MFPDEFFKLREKASTSRNQQDFQQPGVGSKTEQNKAYIRKYLLDNGFKILYIDITGIKEVENCFTKFDSYISYTIKIMTQDFSFEVNRRYSEFLQLYDNIVQSQASKKNMEPNKEIKSIYFFPAKNISCSVLKIFNIKNNSQIAEGRKPYLSSFLNQINTNYSKFPNEFTQHYIELLKFINMKQQHKKFWKKKNPKLLKSPQDAAIATHNKQVEKNSQNNQSINIEYLSQLLQHQINKINLAISTSNSNKLTNVTKSLLEKDESTDLMIVDEIINNVDTIKDIVLEMKRKINCDHIRCIMKGKDIYEGKSIPFNELTSAHKPKIGLIQFSLKHARNELAAIHTIKTILTVLLNSQCNYSSELFQKILSEFEPAQLTFNAHQIYLSKINKEYQELYFKLIKQYLMAKQHHHINKKTNKNKLLINEIMNQQLSKMYEKWLQKEQKNKSFKYKDEQKEWMMVIEQEKENRLKNKKNGNYQQQSSKNCADEQNIYNEHEQDNAIQKNKTSSTEKESKGKENEVNHQKKYKDKHLQIYLNTEKNQQYSKYFIKAVVNNIYYNQCIELIKNEKNWNPLLIDSQLDLYSNTHKQRYKMPGKQEKIFRFIEDEDIEMNLEDQVLENQLTLDQCSHFNNEEDQPNHKSPKMSMQTTQSITTACQEEQHSEGILCPGLTSSFPAQRLSCSQLSQKITFIKNPPIEGKFNSFTQKIKIEKIKPLNNLLNPCLIEILIYLTQPSSIKFFNSEIQCTTTYIWDGIIKLFGNLPSNNESA